MISDALEPTMVGKDTYSCEINHHAWGRQQLMELFGGVDPDSLDEKDHFMKE